MKKLKLPEVQTLTQGHSVYLFLVFANIPQLYFLLLCMHVYLYVGLCMWGQVPTDAEHWISESCSYRQLWVAQCGAEIQTCPPQSSTSLNHSPALQFIFIMVIISQEWDTFLESIWICTEMFSAVARKKGLLYSLWSLVSSISDQLWAVKRPSAGSGGAHQ